MQKMKELSDFRKELESNSSNAFFNIKEILLKSDPVAY